MASLKCKTELNCKYHAFQTWRPVHFCSQQWWEKVKKLLIEFNVLDMATSTFLHISLEALALQPLPFNGIAGMFFRSLKF